MYNNCRETIVSKDDLKLEDYFLERRRKRDEIRNDLLEQIKQREQAILTQKKRNIDLEKNLNDRNRKNNEKYDKEQFAKRQQRIKESRFEYERALLENELKKVKKIINIET